MKNPVWSKALDKSADPQRARAVFERLVVTSAGAMLEKASPEQATVLAALFSGSQAMSDWLVAHPDWLGLLDAELLGSPRRKHGLRNETNAMFEPRLAQGDYAGVLGQLREFKQKQMLRIATRDLARLSNVVEITQEISDVADLCLETVRQVCWRQLVSRFGKPFHQAPDGRWHETEFCVLGMGKLGGQELNYSSDVDVLFVYRDEGQVFKEPPTKTKTPRATMSNHQFFNRLAESFIAEVSKMTGEGSLFRIDLRLRPEGDAGPVTRSVESYENYYAQWGQTWERMMLIKARCVAGSESLAGEFLEMVQNFRYPRSMNENVLREVAAMKRRIEKEILSGDELERNVKLGRGGIREIEFVVQTLQLLNAGRQPFLQLSQTLPGLAKLAQYELIDTADARRLDAAYRFLRDVEHRLQMDQNLQTHTVPTQSNELKRLARLMGFATGKAFELERRSHSRHVRRVYDELLRAGEAETEPEFASEFDSAESEWTTTLREHSFRDPAAAFRRLKEFVEGPGFVHVSRRTTELARQLLPKLLSRCRKGSSRAAGKPFLSDPDRVLTRLDAFVQAYGARATLFEVWNSKPAVFELLLMLFDRSEFLAETVIRSPELLDDLVLSERLRVRKDTAEIVRDLQHGAGDVDQFVWLRRYHEAERLRIGMRDILGLADFEQNLAELSALADACLQYALEVVRREKRLKAAPFVIVGLGKLGGMEINYGSDLDIIFVTAAKPKALPELQKLATRVMELLSRRTERGLVCQTDARLRPDGEKGLLVNTLPACEEYYRQRAQLWEIQALSRTRLVAGDFELGERFQKLTVELTDFSKGNRFRSGLACFTSDWKQKIQEMRARIEKERTPSGQDELAIKTGRGGLMDAEFVAQTLCLEHGWHEANTLLALERGRRESVLPEAEKLIDNYRQLRRVEGILRRWSYEGETVLPDDPAPYYRVAVRCGFDSSEEFRTAMAQWRSAVREVYLRFFDKSAIDP
ncbi:MAG TPA: bifunctional [glutamate--ammonia ligase]-adenylyl-L-tyrosine phosphorylase/[glutamate--ammonia-ligase] adenylyltransferase [Verrucomicrobiae bacterium]|nr:bifunctional [glutamate--ammonia ligase]-adenylyl-L-tyrosine phosphorylase/[glutamate--ammonia-ligase] adenylyltransferase [Verrucomicrobiae bacterium]